MRAIIHTQNFLSSNSELMEGKKSRMAIQKIRATTMKDLFSLGEKLRVV